MFTFVDTQVSAVIADKETTNIAEAATTIIRGLFILLISFTAVFELVSVVNPISVSENHARFVRVPNVLSCK